MRPLFVVTSLVVLSLPVVSQTSAQTPVSDMGHIAGTVRNESGEPVARANIMYGTVTHDGGRSIGGNQANEHGDFELAVPLDTNRISAQAMNAGYWSTGDLNKSGLVVKLTPQQPTAHVVLKIGPRPAQVTLNVMDRDSGQPIQKFKIRVSAMDAQPFSQEMQVHEDKLVPIPADKDMLLMVEAPGYRRWFYKDPANGGDPVLRLESGEERSVDAEMVSEGPPK